MQTLPDKGVSQGIASLPVHDALAVNHQHADWPQAEDGSLEVCVDNWLLSEAGKKGLFVDKDEWGSRLDDLSNTCLSDSTK
jgi:hypothetical protein